MAWQAEWPTLWNALLATFETTTRPLVEFKERHDVSLTSCTELTVAVSPTLEPMRLMELLDVVTTCVDVSLWSLVRSILLGNEPSEYCTVYPQCNFCDMCQRRLQLNLVIQDYDSPITPPHFLLKFLQLRPDETQFHGREYLALRAFIHDRVRTSGRRVQLECNVTLRTQKVTDTKSYIADLKMLALVANRQQRSLAIQYSSAPPIVWRIGSLHLSVDTERQLRRLSTLSFLDVWVPSGFEVSVEIDDGGLVNRLQWLIARPLSRLKNIESLKIVYRGKNDNKTKFVAGVCEVMALLRAGHAPKLRSVGFMNTCEWSAPGDEDLQPLREALGATLLGRSTWLHGVHVQLCMFMWTMEDVRALARGAQDGDAAQSSGPGSLQLNASNMGSETLQAVVTLGTSSTLERLSITCFDEPVSCSVIQTALERSPRLQSLSLNCNLFDASGLKNSSESQAAELVELEMQGARGMGTIHQLSSTEDPWTLQVLAQLLEQVGATIKTLSWRPTAGICSASTASLIASLCPQLQRLSIGSADVAFVEALLAAYDNGVCHVSDLVLTETPLRHEVHGMVPPNDRVMRALQDNTLPVTRCLRRLEICSCSVSIDEASVETAITRNAYLTEARGVCFRKVETLHGTRARNLVVAVSPERWAPVHQALQLACMPQDVVSHCHSFCGRSVGRRVGGG